GEGLRPSLAFLDTETTGLAGGTGTYAFLVGVGRYDGQEFHLAQFFMRDPIEEPALLAALTEFLRPCQALVTFNGKGFDVPLLNARYITNGEQSPLVSLAHLDLLPLARRLWRPRLPSRALGYLEEHILGLIRAQEDVPGWVIPSLYFGYLRSGDARAMKSVFYHNAMDVLSLAALLSHVAGLLDDPLSGAVVHGLDLVAMGKMFENLGRLEKAAQLYERGLSHDLPEDMHWKTVRWLSFVQKRRGNLSAAVTLWREAVRSGQIYAHVELAKFYEHTQRDYGEAAQWTHAALALVNAPDFPRHECRRWLADLEHRLARLHRKLGGGRCHSCPSPSG
ncbi:MAG: ribonuclease H-like domain-containing protein, partial [Planctomycetes bacterium]|nr:ribonuclease H-like domain-containing protein [Planctomycetota bacterium]